MAKHSHKPQSVTIPEAGAASPELQQRAHALWIEEARKCGVDLTGFDPSAPLLSRTAWAVAAALSVAAILTRYSTKKQGSTWDQIRTNVEFAARNRMYCPPELLCVDEAVKGSKTDRPGLSRLRAILRARYATVLLLFKLSRLYRHGHKAKSFIEEEIVEEGLRAVLVNEKIDTADRKGWRLLMGIHGAMDEELLVAIADHVREGLVGLFLKGWTTGALPIGYQPVAVPNGPLTRRGLARTMPGIDQGAADMIRQHYALISGGMSLTDGWMKWRADGGPVDPRCKTGEISYEAYRRMLLRFDYIGVREFCRKRNQWSSKADAIQQKSQPAEEVKVFRCEELRIVDDETFWKVRRLLMGRQTGPRQRRTGEGERVRHLWDLIIGLFRCQHCVDAQGDRRRLHMAGARGQYMRCPNPDCPAPAMVHRRDATAAVCADLSRRLTGDGSLVDEVFASFANLPPDDADGVAAQVEASQRRVRHLEQKIRDTEQLLGVGDDDARQRRRNQINADEGELASEQVKLAQLRRRLQGGNGRADGTPVTRAQVETCLGGLLELLDAAATGRLGKDLVGRAAMVLTQLVDGRVTVVAERRPGRSRWLVRGQYVPRLLAPVRVELGAPADGSPLAASNAPAAPADVTADVWLREAPRVDRLADEVRRMYDEEAMGFRVINTILERKYAEPIGSGNVCAAYRRWYEVRGLPLPPRRTNMGRPRRKAG